LVAYVDKCLRLQVLSSTSDHQLMPTSSVMWFYLRLVDCSSHHPVHWLHSTPLISTGANFIRGWGTSGSVLVAGCLPYDQ